MALSVEKIFRSRCTIGALSILTRSLSKKGDSRHEPRAPASFLLCACRNHVGLRACPCGLRKPSNPNSKPSEKQFRNLHGHPSHVLSQRGYTFLTRPRLPLPLHQPQSCCRQRARSHAASRRQRDDQSDDVNATSEFADRHSNCRQCKRGKARKPASGESRGNAPGFQYLHGRVRRRTPSAVYPPARRPSAYRRLAFKALLQQRST